MRPTVIGEGETLLYTVIVSDTDYPPESFTFSLDPGAPVVTAQIAVFRLDF